jgi:hypothetical protein
VIYQRGLPALPTLRIPIVLIHAEVGPLWRGYETSAAPATDVSDEMEPFTSGAGRHFLRSESTTYQLALALIFGSCSPLAPHLICSCNFLFFAAYHAPTVLAVMWPIGQRSCLSQPCGPPTAGKRGTPQFRLAYSHKDEFPSSNETLLHQPIRYPKICIRTVETLSSVPLVVVHNQGFMAPTSHGL